MMPFLAAVSISFVIFRSAASAPSSSFLRASTTNFLMLVFTALFAALFLSRLSSLCRCLFSADVQFFAKICLQTYLKSDGRRSDLLHFSHSAMFFTLPFSNRVFIFISPPQEHVNFCVLLLVRAFLFVTAIIAPNWDAAAP
jgi:hypothetical protein